MDVLRIYYFILMIGYGSCSIISNISKDTLLRAMLGKEEVRTKMEKILQTKLNRTSTAPCISNGGSIINVNGSLICIFNATSTNNAGLIDQNQNKLEEEMTEIATTLPMKYIGTSTIPCSDGEAIMDVNGTQLCILDVSTTHRRAIETVPEWIWLGIAIFLTALVAALCFCPEGCLEAICFPVRCIVAFILYPIRLVYRCFGSEMPQPNFYIARLQSVRYAPISPEHSLAYLGMPSPPSYNTLNPRSP